MPADDATARTTLKPSKMAPRTRAAKLTKTDITPLPVGTRVEVRCDEEWKPGTVVECRLFAVAVGTPYLVRLDEGSMMIFALAEAIRPLPCFLYDYLNDDLVRMVVWATTEGGTVRPPVALRGVDQRLRTIVNGTRIWRDEWVDARMERCTLAGLSATRSKYEAGGALSIEKKIENLARSINGGWTNDWPRKQAEAYTLITAGLKAPLAAAVRERRSATRRARTLCARRSRSGRSR